MIFVITGFIIMGIGAYALGHITNQKVGRASSGVVASLESKVGAVPVRFAAYLIFLIGIGLMLHGVQSLQS